MYVPPPGTVRVKQTLIPSPKILVKSRPQSRSLVVGFALDLKAKVIAEV